MYNVKVLFVKSLLSRGPNSSMWKTIQQVFIVKCFVYEFKYPDYAPGIHFSIATKCYYTMM
jgi:hypothetical protein